MNETKVKTFIGYKPFPWQAVVHRGIDKYGYRSGHIHCVKAKRQIGKSFIIINELLRFAINYTNTVSCCLSPTLNQARKIYKQILKVTDQTGVVIKKNDSLLEIEFINGSVVVFKSAEQRESLRGYTFNGILCIDEAAYISDEVWSIIRPTCDVYQAPILMVSTPKFRMGFFFETFQMGFLDKNKGQITSYDLCKFDTSALLSNEQLELYRQMLPKNMFTTEYMGEFLDSESIVFGDFKKCIGVNGDYNELYIGIDWGSGVGSDNTVVTALNEHNEMVFQLAFNNKSTMEQINYITEYLSGFGNKVKHIVAECNGLGKPLCDNLKEKIKKIPILEWYTTNQNKIELINKLQVAFEQKKIKILDDDALIAELSIFEAKMNAKGTVQYGAPVGGNDDRVLSLLFALYSKEMKNKKGKYVIGFA